ncbi:MAG: enoyl-CoA hydratase/isomerase family protein [Hyphomonadaceae bacterium]
MSKHLETSITGNIARLTLNRPDALHALNTPMCVDILGALSSWAENDEVHLVVIDHAEGTRGFCAGGDIRMLATSGAQDGAEARAFFAVEYRMNVAIHNFPKPILALMDGVTMGGGVGLSVHGAFRVATERTLFAMPETGIGLFPDVGGGWFLPRLDGELGTWLALTGARLKGADVKAAGVATHYVPSELIANLNAQIAQADFGHGAAEMLAEILGGLDQEVPAPRFAPHLEVINQCFGFDRAEEIVAALRADGGEWAAEQAASIESKSPRTVKVALRQLREGARFATFEENMRNEYRIGARQVQSADFIEGVRAVIIDKDHAPKWAPATLEGVSDETIDSVFAPLTDIDELTF